MNYEFSACESLEFPLTHLIPKKETQQQQFLTKYPKYDGRGIVIAILDTGVDPGVPGLKVTSDGSPKIIDIVNCAGCGDVDTSVVKIAENDIILGLSGRLLKIPETWNNPSGKYHLGLKSIFELFPKALLQRIKNERKVEFDIAHRSALAEARERLNSHMEAHGSMLPETFIEKEERQDLLSYIGLLRNYESMKDYGPVADCIVFQDGLTHRACIDTSYRGRLKLARLLSSFRESYEYSQFSGEDMLNYSVNIRENGRVLEICVPGSGHGTHVASIAAAYFPNEPERAGLAPGAQIISLRIGDGRLNLMETGTSLSKAISYCVDKNVDMINLSYGEGVHFPNSGNIIEKFIAMVKEHGILMVCSAGNNGPALSTGSAPGSTSACAIGVGAVISTEMMEIMYGTIKSLPSTFFQWSSRGPCVDGSRGVTLVAPGAAITNVPDFFLRRNQLLNGTSMSAPNATGSIACLLSALEASKIKWSPYLIKLALENTAIPLPNTCNFARGNGILQIDSAFEFIRKQDGRISPFLVDFAIRVNDKSHRGIYLRESMDARFASEYTVSVEPVFKPNSNNEDKLSYEMHMVLNCSDTFVSHSRMLEMNNQERNLNVLIDPTELEIGSVHYSEVHALDSTNIEMGPLFRIPITVIKPLVLNSLSNPKFVCDMVCKPAVAVRNFIGVPLDADCATLTLRSQDDHVARICVHVLQVVPGDSFTSSEFINYAKLLPRSENKFVIPLKGGLTMELCIIKSWVCSNESAINVELQFNGIKPIQEQLNFISSELVHSFKIRNISSRYDCLAAAITYRYLCCPIAPLNSKIMPLLARVEATMDGGPMFSLLLTYSYIQHRDSEINMMFLGVSNYLYENCFNDIFIMVFSDSKEYIGSFSSFPLKYSIEMKKGEYNIHVRIRHESDQLLEKYREMPITIRSKLQHPINMDCYADMNSAIRCHGVRLIDTSLKPGEVLGVYVSRLPAEKLPKNSLRGCYLQGKLVLSKNACVRKAVQYDVTYTFTEKIHQVNSTASMTTENNYCDCDSNGLRMMSDAVCNAQIKCLQNLNKSDATSTFLGIMHNAKDSFTVMQSLLSYCLNTIVSTDASEYQLLLIESRDELIDRILVSAGPNDVLQYLGVKGHGMELVKKSEMNLRRSAIVAATIARAELLIDNHLAGSTEDIPHLFRKGLLKACSSIQSVDVGMKRIIGKDSKEKDNELYSSAYILRKLRMVEIDETLQKTTLEEADKAFYEVLRWTGPDDINICLMRTKHAVAHGYFGLALTLLHKALDDSNCTNSIYLDICILQIVEHLGWSHIAKNLDNSLLIKYPRQYRPF